MNAHDMILKVSAITAKGRSLEKNMVSFVEPKQTEKNLYHLQPFKLLTEQHVFLQIYSHADYSSM